MEYFNKYSSFNANRLIYRRLARLHHPDMGGNPEVMKRINIEFELIKKQHLNKTITFDHITVGDIVIINKSISKVTAVSKKTFTAKSEYTNRCAEFSKATGVCLSNPKFIASIPKKINNAG